VNEDRRGESLFDTVTTVKKIIFLERKFSGTDITVFARIENVSSQMRVTY
jgi:hypothetical protein